MSDSDFVTTRRALHAVAELVLAGPQYRAAGDIRLLVSPGGFRTFTDPDFQVVGTDVVAGPRRVAIDGTTARFLGAAVGAEAGAPEGVYGTGSGVSVDDDLHVDPAAAAQIARAYELDDRALQLLAPDGRRVLWAEHFDVGVRVDEINYGVSPEHLAEPYAYVGVDPVPDDPYWNAPFGVSRMMSSFADPAALGRFFGEARDRARTGLSG